MISSYSSIRKKIDDFVIKSSKLITKNNIIEDKKEIRNLEGNY